MRLSFCGSTLKKLEAVKFLWKRKHFEKRSWKWKQTRKRLTLYGDGSGSKIFYIPKFHILLLLLEGSTSLTKTRHWAQWFIRRLEHISVKICCNALGVKNIKVLLLENNGKNLFACARVYLLESHWRSPLMLCQHIGLVKKLQSDIRRI